MAWFDAHAEGYDEWYDTDLGRYVDDVEKELVEELAELRPGERVLDLGCGTGNHAVWLAAKGLQVTGLDESPAMLARAAGNAAAAGVQVDWVLGIGEALPFDDGGFDLVVSVAALEFMEHRKAVLRRAMRLLRPGGRLVAGLLTRDSAWGELYLGAAREDPGNVFARAHLFTEHEVAGLLDQPYALRKGLYHPPAPALDRAVADRVEASGRREQADGAGFFAVRWRKEEA